MVLDDEEAVSKYGMDQWLGRPRTNRAARAICKRHWLAVWFKLMFSKWTVPGRYISPLFHKEPQSTSLHQVIVSLFIIFEESAHRMLAQACLSTLLCLDATKGFHLPTMPPDIG